MTLLEYFIPADGMNAMCNDILKTQKVDGSILYDSLELSFNTVDKTSILKVNNIDILK